VIASTSEPVNLMIAALALVGPTSQDATISRQPEDLVSVVVSSDILVKAEDSASICDHIGWSGQLIRLPNEKVHPRKSITRLSMLFSLAGKWILMRRQI
jgi:hypothetical protein